MHLTRDRGLEIVWSAAGLSQVHNKERGQFPIISHEKEYRLAKNGVKRENIFTVLLNKLSFVT